ncbi:MAG: VOC family protein [Actinobacteria bacterium]|nr:VOC family protein [Actinomycetota bacterium]
MEPRISIITLGVADLPRAIRFYRDGLGFETTAAADAGIAFFRTSGTCLALYPRDRLAEDVSPNLSAAVPAFSGVTLAHAARTREEVDSILALAEAAGGTIVKPAEVTFWGGYSGYFRDLDGHFWEVAWWQDWEFNDDGSLVIE